MYDSWSREKRKDRQLVGQGWGGSLALPHSLLLFGWLKKYNYLYYNLLNNIRNNLHYLLLHIKYFICDRQT